MTAKYTTQNGIRKQNPAYVPPAVTPSAPPLPFVNKSTALAVIPVPAAAAAAEDEEEIVVTPMYEAAVAQYHEEVEPEIFVGAEQPDCGLDELNQVLAKYEVPAGMLAKLLDLRKFDAAEIIVDDSGSMTLQTDAKDPKGMPMNRWWEAKWRITQIMELMAYVLSPPLTVTFLNRPNVLHLQRSDGEVPTAYIQRVESILMEAFRVGPGGRTPAREAIEASLSRNGDKSVLRFFLGDGVPNGGEYACRQIENMLLHRPSPERNPFTFMSCTNNDSDVEWMKECEEKAPFCAEFDDYMDESREILKDQGQAFPYSFGLHLVAQIVAAFNPHDLDALDESVPLTRQTLDNLLGYQSSPQEYKYYYDCFVTAQRRLPQGHLQRTFVNQLPSLYAQFETAAIANDIPAAAEYKMRQRNQRNVVTGTRNYQPVAQDDCCVIL
mmetsp:Transcript_7856/g.16405  ORF Transcript_7856/g.16405 Transcript_7856/m.16405 type:complete len:437 (+) Transcript_7856:243-1553(+)